MVALREGVGFTHKDAENLERVKDAMAELHAFKTRVVSHCNGDCWW